MHDPVSHYTAWHPADPTALTIHKDHDCPTVTRQHNMGAGYTRRDAILTTLTLCPACCFVEVEDRADAQAMGRLMWSERINEEPSGVCVVCNAVRTPDGKGRNSSTLQHTADCIVPLAWVYQERLADA
jgi:hypothetical protein